MATTVVNIRDVREWTKDHVYIGRSRNPMGFPVGPSKWGNPFRIGVHGSREEVISKYEIYIMEQPHLLDALGELRGKILVCHCKPLSCHGDILARLADDEVDLK